MKAVIDIEVDSFYKGGIQIATKDGFKLVPFTLPDNYISTQEMEKIKREYAIEMCEKQKQICQDNATTMYQVDDIEGILDSPYPEELRSTDGE